MKILLISIAGCFLLTSCARINKWMGWKDNNLVEQVAEDAIELSCGQHVDLSAVKPSEEKP